VIGTSNGGKEVDIVKREGAPAGLVDETMPCGNDEIGRDQRPRALTRGPEAADIDLADRIPGRALILKDDAIVLADDAGTKLVPGGARSGKNHGAEDQTRRGQSPHRENSGTPS
jgi:hypothetical protein